MKQISRRYTAQVDGIVVIATDTAMEEQALMLDGNDPPFWQTKTLEEMSREEWEALCDGCGRCCLVKLEDEDTAQIYLTRLACGMLDTRTCRCKDYPNRFNKMPDCLEIDIARTRELSWLPKTCAYRLVDEGHGLMWWHPLVSGTTDTVHEAGISVRSFAMSERRVKQENYWKYIIPDEGPEEAAKPAHQRRRRNASAVPPEPAE